IQARLMALSSFNPEIRSLQRLIVGFADDVDVDGNGRILVPPALREYASLEHRVVLAGQGNKFELWDAAKWGDETARAVTSASGAIADPRFVFRRAWFSELPRVLEGIGIDAIDGALLDLGISSPQIDDPARGFSLRTDGPLDMRMDPTRGESAAAFLARADVRELTEVIRDYGEERFAQSVARAIVAARTVAPIVRTRQLAGIVAQAVRTRPRGDWR